MIVKISFETNVNSVDINEIINVINSSLNGDMSAFKINVQNIPKTPKIEYPIMGEEYYDNNGMPLEFVDGTKYQTTGKLIKRRLSDFDRSEDWPISAAPTGA